MKKQIFGYAAVVSMVLALTGVFVLGAVCTSRAADQAIVLKYQGKWVGNVHMAWANEQMKFADRVKAATGGKVVVQNMDEVKADNAVIDGDPERRPRHGQPADPLARGIGAARLHLDALHPLG